MVVCEERTIFNGSLPLNVGILQDQHKKLNMIFTNFQYENAYFFGTKKRPQKTHDRVGVLSLPQKLEYQGIKPNLIYFYEIQVVYTPMVQN